MEGVTLGGEAEAEGCWRVEEGYLEAGAVMETSRRRNWVVVVVVVAEQQKEMKRVLLEIKKWVEFNDSLADMKLLEVLLTRDTIFMTLILPYGTPYIKLKEETAAMSKPVTAPADPDVLESP